jgi:hypothetical protein
MADLDFSLIGDEPKQENLHMGEPLTNEVEEASQSRIHMGEPLEDPSRNTGQLL